MDQAQIRGDSLSRHALNFTSEILEACSETEAFMLIRPNIQNNGSLPNQEIISKSSSKNETSCIQPLSTFVIQHDLSTNQRALFRIFFFVLFLAWVLQIFRIFVHTLDLLSILHKKKVEIFPDVWQPIKFAFRCCSYSVSFLYLGPKLWAFPIFLNVFQTKLLLKNSTKNILTANAYKSWSMNYRKSNTFCFSLLHEYQ